MFPNGGPYEKDLKQNINRFRWFEYALSSSIMIVLIATLFGIKDIGSLILIFVVNATMNLFGLVMEQLNMKREQKLNWGTICLGKHRWHRPLGRHSYLYVWNRQFRPCSLVCLGDCCNIFRCL